MPNLRLDLRELTGKAMILGLGPGPGLGFAAEVGRGLGLGTRR